MAGVGTPDSGKLRFVAYRRPPVQGRIYESAIHLHATHPDFRKVLPVPTLRMQSIKLRQGKVLVPGSGSMEAGWTGRLVGPGLANPSTTGWWCSQLFVGHGAKWQWLDGRDQLIVGSSSSSSRKCRIKFRHDAKDSVIQIPG